MKETIPCRVVLANRHVKVTGQCPLCEVGAEDIKHKSIWSKLGLGELINKAWRVDHASQAVLEYLICEDQQYPMLLGQSKIPKLVAVTCWYLWWERRQATKGEHVKDPDKSATAIGALYSNFTAAYIAKPKARRVGWEKSTQDFVKLNVDAAFYADDLRGQPGRIHSSELQQNRIRA
jgi:hypothetical protein